MHGAQLDISGNGLPVRPLTGGAKTLRRLDYHPKTFAARGAVVPFTTRLLSQARVRPATRDKETEDRGIEALLPGFAGGTSIYVTPLDTLGEVLSLTVHDRALASLIAERGSVSPMQIRRCWTQIARSGLAGSGEMQRAIDWERAHAAVFHADQTVMLQELARFHGLALPEGLTGEMLSRSGNAVFTRAVEAFAKVGELDGGAIERNLAELVELLAGIGLKQSPRAGPFRDLVWEVDELAQMLTIWGRDTMADVGPMAIFCGEAAAFSAGLARSSLAAVDRLTSDVGPVIDAWPEAAPALKREIGRLHWLLDGWEHMIGLWNAVIEGRAIAEDIIQEMTRILPIVPPDETRDSRSWNSVSSTTMAVSQPVNGRAGRLLR
ncbi:hypothetical protein [Minwuia sp.]|uniref:hypothetical protein n=1 Tax=Minwuia sp. TaxID=2493630 RepID=UPI003A8EA0F5